MLTGAGLEIVAEVRFPSDGEQVAQVLIAARRPGPSR